MKLEAQLLKIIEDQQLQLKQQQQEQEKALQLIQQQSGTIEQLKSYTNTLNSKHQEAVKIVQKYQQFVQELSEQTISATFSQDVQESLKIQLQTRLNDLVKNLQIENQVHSLIKQEIPLLAQAEIERQLKPMALQMKEKFDSVSSYHEKFQDLVQEISSRL